MNRKKLNKQQYVYQTLRTNILDGSYSPGYRIVIDQVARELGVSAIPVREAIRQLEADGLIEYRPYSGAVVTPIDENEYIETLTVLAVTEGYATALSAQFFPDEALSELKEANDRMQEALEQYDFMQFSTGNRTFHERIYAHCPNNYLIEHIKQTWSRLDSIRRQGAAFIPGRAVESIREHKTIIRMIREKQPFAKIEAFARQHKMNTVTYFHQLKEKNEAHPLLP